MCISYNDVSHIRVCIFIFDNVLVFFPNRSDLMRFLFYFIIIVFFFAIIFRPHSTYNVYNNI